MVNRKAGIGIVGCGTISGIYLTNLTKHFDNLEVIGCADIVLEKAIEAKTQYGLSKACSVDELMADPDVDIVVNLTIPAAHYEINMKALNAGKHIYCEKPFAISLSDADEILALAKRKNLLVGSAPDTFLGAGIQTCGRLIEDGVIGKPIGFTANLVTHGHELWHPAPVFYYKKGAGPMLDMGPYYLTALAYLLGPIKQIACFARTSESQREIQGKMVDVDVLTNYAGIVDFANGVIGNVNMSFDVWKSNQPGIEIYGTNGVIFVPDPNMFGGPVKVFRSAGLIEKINTTCNTPFERIMALQGFATDEFMTGEPLLYPAEDTDRSNMRGLGVSDMAQAFLDGRPNRANGELARHVVEALLAFEVSERENQIYQMKTTFDRPAPFPLGLELWEVD